MSLIQNIRHYPAKHPDAPRILLMCGFGGAIWQTKRLINKLRRMGYDITALDFPKEVLSSGDPTLLPKLMDEVTTFAELEAQKSDQKILLVGISLGALISLNIFRRSNAFDTGILITGGNIVTVAQNIFGSKVWPQTHEELSEIWKDVNMFTDPAQLTGKRMLFVLPKKDTLIDTSEVLQEIARQNAAGNTIQLVKRGSFGHIGTIIEETILFPGRIKRYIEMVG